MLWKKDKSNLPVNISVARSRFNTLIRQIQRDEKFKEQYVACIEGYISKNYAREVTPSEENKISPRTWYLPHHGVTNPNKLGKVRVVFDAAAKHDGTSFNDNLMTGPDLLNSLFGVIQRFRLFEIALVADVQAMFHQVRVPDVDTDSLRFFWKTDFSKPGPPDTYKMFVHIFGAADSPCCANYAIKRTAKDNADCFSELAIQTVLRDFYVDDLITSLPSEPKATVLAHELANLLNKGGFRLCQWMSNRVSILATFEDKDRAVQNFNLDLDEFPVQRALGLKWNVSEDCFIFSPYRKPITHTKRGIVSTVSSIFDPCGFLAPFTFRAKCLIQ